MSSEDSLLSFYNFRKLLPRFCGLICCSLSSSTLSTQDPRPRTPSQVGALEPPWCLLVGVQPGCRRIQRRIMLPNHASKAVPLELELTIDFV